MEKLTKPSPGATTRAVAESMLETVREARRVVRLHRATLLKLQRARRQRDEATRAGRLAEAKIRTLRSTLVRLKQKRLLELEGTGIHPSDDGWIELLDDALAGGAS